MSESVTYETRRVECIECGRKQDVQVVVSQSTKSPNFTDVIVGQKCAECGHDLGSDNADDY